MRSPLKDDYNAFDVTWSVYLKLSASFGTEVICGALVLLNQRGSSNTCGVRTSVYRNRQSKFNATCDNVSLIELLRPRERARRNSHHGNHTIKLHFTLSLQLLSGKLPSELSAGFWESRRHSNGTTRGRGKWCDTRQ